jgi:hypothetical protein
LGLFLVLTVAQVSQNGETFGDENLTVFSHIICSSKDVPYTEEPWQDYAGNGGWVSNNADGTIDIGLGKRVSNLLLFLFVSLAFLFFLLCSNSACEANPNPPSR